MDLIKAISNLLGIVCGIIGILLVPLGIWFLRPAIKNKNRPYLIIGLLILALAIGCFIAAFGLFTTGIMKLAPALPTAP
jgi:hypothetical protein